MFVTGLTYQNIIDREPALADFDTSYATSFTGLIAEAKAVIDNRLRALGYDLDKIGAKTDVWDWDNNLSNSVEKTITGVGSGQLLLILSTWDNASLSLYIYQNGDSNYKIVDITSVTLTPLPMSILLPYVNSTSITFVLTSGDNITANSIKAYLTDPAIYFLHLYKSLQLIYGSMRSAPGDLFEMQMNYYSDLYENEFNSLVTYYDRNGNGVIEQGEMQHLKRTRVFR